MRRKSIFRILDRYFGIPLLSFLAIFLKRKRNLPDNEIKEILIIKFAAIGDSILLIPMLRTLKKKFSDAAVTFLCSPINESIIRRIPYIDRIIVSDVHSYLANPISAIKFILELRKIRYDVIIDTEQWSRISPILMTFMKYRYTVGFKTQNQFRHFMYNSVILHSKTKHELETFMELLLPLNVPVELNDLQLQYFLTDENKTTAAKFYEDHQLFDKTVICLHPGCGENGRPREWEVGNYVSLGKKLINYDKSIILVVTGSPDEYEKCRLITEGIRENIINIAGRYTLDEVVAIVSMVKLIVCSNTGMLHLASCVGTKTMGLHGPTNPSKWGAFSKNTVLIQSDKYCSPCLYLGHDYGCNAPSCMLHISVDDVFIHIRKALNPELFPSVKVKDLYL